MLSLNAFKKLQADTLETAGIDAAELTASLSEFVNLNAAAEDAAKARKGAGELAVDVLSAMFSDYEQAEESRDYIAAFWVVPNLPESQRDIIAAPAPGRRDKSAAANELRKSRKSIQSKVSQYAGRLIDRAFPAAKLTNSEKIRAAVEALQGKLEGFAKNGVETDFDLVAAYDTVLALAVRVRKFQPAE